MSVPLFANPADEKRIKVLILKRVTRGLSVSSDDMGNMPSVFSRYEIGEVSIATSMLINDGLLKEVGECESAVRAVVNRGGIRFVNVGITKGGISWLSDARWAWLRRIRDSFLEGLVTKFASSLGAFFAGIAIGYLIRLFSAK